MTTVEPLATLLPQYGAVLSLVHQHGWGYDRIASYVGLRREVVARLMFEARELLTDTDARPTDNETKGRDDV